MPLCRAAPGPACRPGRAGAAAAVVPCQRRLCAHAPHFNQALTRGRTTIGGCSLQQAQPSSYSPTSAGVFVLSASACTPASISAASSWYTILQGCERHSTPDEVPRNVGIDTRAPAKGGSKCEGRSAHHALLSGVAAPGRQPMHCRDRTSTHDVRPLLWALRRSVLHPERLSMLHPPVPLHRVLALKCRTHNGHPAAENRPCNE